MKKTNLEKLNLTLYEDIMPNGLRVFIVPKDNVNSVYATLSTKYGSNVNEFVPINKKEMIKVPLGIAHFLEHKMFEMKDGKDPFTFYSERGCDANANTSNIKTTYLFSGSNAFYENLDYLLNYVQNPYFTDENVEKEKGIIEQEIKMYDDVPYFKLYERLLYNSFINHPIKYPIAGTIEQINKITKEDLYTCYNTFYNPANMFLVIVGNVDVKEAFNSIRVNQEDKSFDSFEEIKIKQIDEPDTVEKEKEVLNMDIQIPKVGIAYKFNCSKLKKNINDIKSYLSIIFDIKVGATSILNERLKEQNLISSDIDFNLINTDKHILVSVSVETNEYDKVINEIESELSSLDISNEDFERKKKVRKSGAIYRSDSIYSINTKIMNDIMKYDMVITDDYKKIDELKYSYLKTILKSIKIKNKSILIIEKS